MQEEEVIRKKNVGITKSTAKKNISILLDTVKLINETDDKYKYPYRVKDIVLFGSYLTDKQKLGDVDIFFELENRWDNNEEMRKYFKDVRTHTSYIEYLYNAQFYTLKLLRNKKPCFSFMDLYFFQSFLKEENFNYVVLVENFEFTNNKY